MIDDDIKIKIFEKEFYVYELIDSITSNVFYVGKGKKYRCFTHEYKTRNGNIPHNNKHLFNTINKLINSNIDIIYNIVFTSNNEDKCYEIEENIISNYGIDNLCNIELSARGIKHTEETRKKISNANTGRKCSEETREKLRLINIGKYQSVETRTKRSESLKGRTSPMKGRNHTESTKEKMSKSGTGRKHTEDSIKKMKDSHKGKIISEEQRRKTSKKLMKERIVIIKECEFCENEFNVTIIKDGVNNTRRCCDSSCSSKLANKNRRG